MVSYFAILLCIMNTHCSLTLDTTSSIFHSNFIYSNCIDSLYHSSWFCYVSFIKNKVHYTFCFVLNARVPLYPSSTNIFLSASQTTQTGRNMILPNARYISAFCARVIPRVQTYKCQMFCTSFLKCRVF